MATEKDLFTILIDHNTDTDKDISKVYTPISVYVVRLINILNTMCVFIIRHYKLYKCFLWLTKDDDFLYQMCFKYSTLKQLFSFFTTRGHSIINLLEMYTVYMKHFHKYIHTSLSQMAKFGHKRMITTSKYCRLLKSTAGVLG